jgi:hypothetical protein
MKTGFFYRAWVWFWNEVLYPVADHFYPRNDCSVCYFWRAFCVGVYTSCVAAAAFTASWGWLVYLVVVGAVGLFYLWFVDNTDWLDKK